MGYTHYWRTTKFKDEQWARLCESTKKVITLAVEQGIMVDREDDDEDQPPLICDSLITFNGRGDEGYETFYFQKNNTTFQFCKTGLRPYDAVVVAVLILAHYYDNDFYWSSDGDRDDFDDGLALANEFVEILELGNETADCSNE